MLQHVKFSSLQILKQMKNDLWCKEITTGYNVSYAWMANQLGHFTIGFVPTVILGVILQTIFGLNILISLVCLLPILYMIYKENQDKQVEKENYKKIDGLYPLNIKDIDKNIWTTNLFVIVGALTASTIFILHVMPVFLKQSLILIVLIVLSIPCWFVLKYWISKKICFQRATFPYIFRLFYCKKSMFKDSNESKSIVGKFLNGEIDHLIINGKPKTGKTNFAIAIGTELTFNRCKIRYTDLFSFLRDSTTEELVHSGFVPWLYNDVDVLIIDDIGDKDEFYKVLKLNDNEYSKFKDKKFIWVIEYTADSTIDKFMDNLNLVFSNKIINIIEMSDLS